MSTSSNTPAAVGDPQRLAAVHRTGLLDSLAEESFDRLTRLAARVLDAPVALVSLVDADRQFFKSCVGLPEPWSSERQTPLSHSFCQHVVAGDEPLVVHDAREHPLLHDNLAIPDLDIVAYAGWPVHAPDGTPIGSFCVTDPKPRTWTSDELASLADIAASVDVEIALRETVVRERAARDKLLTTNQRLRFLAEASALLSQTLEPERILQALADLAVPGLADWCLIDVVDGGRPQRRAFAHAGRQGDAIARQLADYPPNAAMPEGPGKVLRTGKPELITSVTGEWLARKAHDERHLELLQRMNLVSMAFVPLIAKGTVTGVMTFGSSDPDAPYEPDELEVFVELGQRAAIAVENGRLYAERDKVARTLQRSLLPPALPDIPGFDLAVTYAPGGAGTQIGGDFYDVFRNPWGQWVIAIGDVCGKGVNAAIATGLARHTVRAAATDNRGPIEILQVLNSVLVADEAVGGAGRFCSVLLAVLAEEEGTVRLTFASGGHPPPLVRRADGRVDEPAAGGMLLGLFEDVAFEATTVELAEGDLLAVYTDGVTEARAAGEMFGSQRLADLVGRVGAEGAERLATGVLDAVLAWQGGQTSDDTAVLVVERARPAQPSNRLGSPPTS